MVFVARAVALELHGGIRFSQEKQILLRQAWQRGCRVAMRRKGLFDWRVRAFTIDYNNSAKYSCAVVLTVEIRSSTGSLRMSNAVRRMVSTGEPNLTFKSLA